MCVDFLQNVFDDKKALFYFLICDSFFLRLRFLILYICDKFMHLITIWNLFFFLIRNCFVYYWGVIFLSRLGISPASDDEDEDDEHEEEFYWTEVEVNVATSVDLHPEHTHPPSPPFNPPRTAPMHPPAAAAAAPPGPAPLSTAHFLPPTRMLHPGNSPALTMVSSPPTLSHMDMARPPHEGKHQGHQPCLGF